MRDSLIILLIIIIVIIGNVISQNILEKDSENLINELEVLQQQLETEEAKHIVEDIYKLWEETEERWSIIVLHQELDSIKTAILGVKSGIESNDLDYSYQQIQNSIFLVGHIKEKEALKWKNIF